MLLQSRDGACLFLWAIQDYWRKLLGPNITRIRAETPEQFCKMLCVRMNKRKATVNTARSDENWIQVFQMICDENGDNAVNRAEAVQRVEQPWQGDGLGSYSLAVEITQNFHIL